MSLVQYKPQFDNAYQDIFQKVLVAKSIANGRFESTLKYGASVARVAYSIDAVRVRSVTRGSASTIDTLTDSVETLTINLEKEAVFYISDGEVTQAGPLNPGEVIGGQIAIKVAADFDARIFAEVVNAYQTFDTGDLTTSASNGTPITLSSTTVPQMVTRMPAKLRNVNVLITNMAFVVDAYAASDIEQYLLGKQFSIVESVFKNGYAGPIATAEVYVSQNLMAETVLTSTSTFSNGETVVIGGVTFTFVTTIGSTAGNVLIGASETASLTNLVALINAPATTTAQGVALSTADQIKVQDTLKLVADSTDSLVHKVRVRGTGAGRIAVSETAANASFSAPFIHCYYGKKGSIDYVMQDMSSVDMRQTPDRRGTNVFSSYLAGIKTFTDGARKFLDVLVLA